MEVTVVGAGIIGLTTAITLEEQGHEVRVVAARRGPATTSSVAGAVWFPYRAGPPERVAHWAQITRRWLVRLARTVPAAGVDILTGYEITRDGDGSGERPWWAAQPTMEGDDLALDIADVERAQSPVTGHPGAWRYTAPRAQPSLFLPYLESRLHHAIEERTVADLAAEAGDAIINCTGLAARELTGDDQLVPLLGQVVYADRGGADASLHITDDRDPDAIFYIIPRRDEVVLGGCSRPFPPGAEPEIDPAITGRILAQAQSLGIAVGNVRAERVGLRPFRAHVRLERDPHARRVIHNYGHGGAGFTLSRGCAEEVAELVSRADR
jgi:D-amino-acid oxidase